VLRAALSTDLEDRVTVEPTARLTPPIGSSEVLRDGLEWRSRVDDPWAMDSRFAARLLDRTTQPFAVTDLEGRFLRVNPAFEALIGYSQLELRNMSFRDLTPEASQAVSSEALQRLSVTGTAQRYEKEYRRKDGATVPLDMVVDYYRDDQDRPIGYYGFITDISQRKATEHALRDSEDRFRRLYNEAPFGYHELDLGGNIVNVNQTECDMLGYTRDEMLGRPIFDFLAEDEREDARASFRDRIEHPDAVMSFERNYRTKDGRHVTMAVDNRLTRDEDGRVVGMRSTLQDISTRKQTEAALIASERRARALFEGIEDAVFVHDMNGRILDANPAACRRLGYSRTEFLDLTTADVDDPDFAAGYEDRLQSQLRVGHLSCEGRHRTKDGRIIPVEINTSTISLEDETAVLAVIRDITERKALEETRRQFAEAQLRSAREIEAKNEELVRSEERYRRFMEGSLDAVVVADQDGQMTLFNPAAERTFGYSADEVLGQSLALLIPEEGGEAATDGIRCDLQARHPRLVGHTIELNGRRKNGELFPLELSLNAIELPDGVQFVGSIRDQTERQRMRAMLAQSDKLASIGLLSAGVAHEINNPLAYIANNLAVLDRDLKGILDLVAAYQVLDEQLAETAPEVLKQVRAIREELDWEYVNDNLGRMLSRTRDGVQRVANIVQNLRGLARTSPPKMEPALLSEVLGQALEMVQGRLRRGNIELRVSEVRLPKVACVPSQISQVILNLLINAIQAVETVERPDGRRIDVVVRAEHGWQLIEIRDSGVGIPAESLPHLFDPFFTTKPVGEGTGLGLSISHGIVTGHGGRIEVESEPDKGTTFRVMLPATD
jgi:two-component system, NtrC family, sensor kinase